MSHNCGIELPGENMSLIRVVAVILLACSVTAATNETETLTYCDLMKNPSAFSGKRIRLRALYSYMFEVSRLKAPSCCANPDLPIWVEFSENLDRKSDKLFHSFPEGMGIVLATFEGVLVSGESYGDGGYRFKFTVDKIEALEHKGNPGPDRHPAWIPNCARR